MGYRNLSTLLRHTTCLIDLRDRRGDTIIIEHARALAEKLGSKILNSKILYYERVSSYEIKVVLDLNIKKGE